MNISIVIWHWSNGTNFSAALSEQNDRTELTITQENITDEKVESAFIAELEYSADDLKKLPEK